MQVQSKITCPECRNEGTVPLGGVQKLPSNFFINRLVDELIRKNAKEGDEEVQCDNCDENDPVVAYCSDCSFFLCQICYCYHRRDRTTRKHGMVPLSNNIITNPEQTIVMALQCKEHRSNELQYYCETCDELICMYCTVKEHYGHSHDTISKMASKYRHKLNENVATVENIFKNLSRIQSGIEMAIINVKDQKDNLIEEIDQQYDALIDKIMDQRDKMKQQVHTTVSEKVKALTVQLEEIGSMQMQFLYMKEQNDSVKKSNNPDEILLSIYKQVTADARQWMEAYDQLETRPVELDTMQFFTDEVPFPQFGQVFSKPDPRKCELSNLPKCIFQDVPVEFCITAKYSNGHRYFRGGSQVSVQAQLQLESGDFKNVVSYVKDNDNGTYTATFTVKQVGKLKIIVLFDGEQIKNSPYNITVGKNYPSIKRPSNIVDFTHGSMACAAKPWGIAFGKNGVWTVADWSNHCIHVFHKEDQLWKFGNKGSNNGQLNGPCGIAFDNSNHLYVADFNNNRVQKFDISGNYLLQFTGKQYTDGHVSNPIDVTTHEDMVYVADPTAKCIMKFNTNGQFCQLIGKGCLSNPNGVTVNSSNHLMVTDIHDNCIYVFSLNGQHLGRFGTSGSEIDQMTSPRSITSDVNGFILVTDTGNHRITIFDKDGKILHQFGSKGTRNSQFLNPRGIALAPNGKIYISDNLNNCIKVFQV